MHVPGLHGTRHLFARQVPLLAPAYRVSVYELTDAPGSTLETLVGDLDDHIGRAFPGEPVLLLGESFGGALALLYVLAHPERVAALVVLNSFAHMTGRWDLRLAIFLLRLFPWAATLRLRRWARFLLLSRRTPDRDRDLFYRAAGLAAREGYLRRLEMLRTFDVRPRLAEIRVPALLLAADRDRLLPSLRTARRLQTRIPRASLRILHREGHACLLSTDIDLRTILDPWIAREAGPR